jgi:glycosyltransferase involved in cell wall biosynthesis
MTVGSRSTIDLVCLGYNPWSRMWKRNQQIVWGLSQEPWIGRVVFVNPDVWAAGLLLSPRRALNLVGRSNWKAVVPRAVAPKITVCTPLHLPLAGRLAWLRRTETRLTRGIIDRRIAGPVVLLVNRPADPNTPLVSDLWRRAVLRVFDWSDDFESFSHDDAERAATRAVCEHYVRACDVTFAVNDRLGARARAAGSPSAHVITNGTDVRNFQRALPGGVEIARPLRGLRRPVVGYIGYRVRDRLDLDLIDFLARARPDWSFVFVGPAVGDEPLAEILAVRPNVRVIPAVDYFALPAYLAAFDACVLPNRVNIHTAGNDPIKIYDYLAAGKPIVSTAVSGADRFGELVQIAASGAPFLQALDRALATDSPELRERRHQAAQAHSWEARTRVAAGVIREALAARGVPTGR